LVDKETGAMGGAHYLPRTEVKKANESYVGTGLLLDAGYSCFSAVMHSTVNCTNTDSALGADFDVIRNPLAEVPVPPNAFPWATNWVFNDQTLYRIDAAP